MNVGVFVRLHPIEIYENGAVENNRVALKL